MRIVGGILKGKKIDFIKSSITRPLKNMVKESVFNVINHSPLINLKLVNSSVLDLYSGIGSFGIECISRGSKKITFVEKDKNAVKLLKKNLSTLNVSHKADIKVCDTNYYFQNLKIEDKFEIIFLDPPFAEKYNFFEDLNSIKKMNILASNHIIILHRESKTFDKFDGSFNVILKKKYGRSQVIFGKF